MKMKPGDIITIFIMFLFVVFLMGVNPKPKPANAQAQIPVPLHCEEFYQKSMSNLKLAEEFRVKDVPTEYAVRFYSRSAAYGIAYQNCIERNEK